MNGHHRLVKSVVGRYIRIFVISLGELVFIIVWVFEIKTGQ